MKICFFLKCIDVIVKLLCRLTGRFSLERHDWKNLSTSVIAMTAHRQGSSQASFPPMSSLSASPNPSRTKRVQKLLEPAVACSLLSKLGNNTKPLANFVAFQTWLPLKLYNFTITWAVAAAPPSWGRNGHLT